MISSTFAPTFAPTFALDARFVAGTNTGDSTYWSGLLYGLAKIQPNARFLLFSNRDRPDLIPDGDQFVWIRVPAKSSRWWSLVSFPLAARRLRADRIHTQYSLSPLVGSIGITTIHDVSFFIGPEWFKPKDRLILQKSIPRAARRAKAVITVSETSRSELNRFVPGIGDKISVTYNACPPWIVRTNRDQARKLSAEFLGTRSPFALTVGTRWPRKNMDLAVSAVEGLSDRFPHRLVITGKAGWGRTLAGSRVISPGYVSNEQISLLYSAASLYLAPSRHEGFGLPILEAFRCGCPVMTSSGGALPEVVGNAGVVQPTWEPADWTASVEALLSDSSKLLDLEKKGLEREALFSWEEMARLTLEIYLGGTS